MSWPFDQAENVATLTTKQVVEGGLPILSVVHYSDDHSWGFLCGTTAESEDLMMVSMKYAVDLDPTLKDIADLPPGWCADRTAVGEAWNKYEDASI